MLTEGSCSSGTGDSPSITDKSRPCVGRSLSVPGFGSLSGGVSVRRQARGLRSLSAATGRKIRGHRRKTFPSPVPRPPRPPRPHPCQKLPDILQGRAHGKIAGTRERERERERKKCYKEIYFYSKRRGLSSGTLSTLKQPAGVWGKRRATITREVRFDWINNV